MYSWSKLYSNFESMRVAAEGQEGHRWPRHFCWSFFSTAQQAGRNLKFCSEVLLQSKVWTYLFLGEFIPTALMYDHEKNVPLKPIFRMCFLVAVVLLEVYNDPLSNVMLCHKMQASRLIVLKELSYVKWHNYTLFWILNRAYLYAVRNIMLEKMHVCLPYELP